MPESCLETRFLRLEVKNRCMPNGLCLAVPWGFCEKRGSNVASPHTKAQARCASSPRQRPDPMSLIETPASDDSLHPPIESLIVAAQREEARPTRSRLEPCAQIIFILRGKRWSFAAITAWLAQNGVQVAESTVQRFYRTRHRSDPGRGQTALTSTHRPESCFDSTHENSQSQSGGSSARPARKPKYNTDF